MENEKLEKMKNVSAEWLREQGFSIENGTIIDAGFEEINGVATIGVSVQFEHGGCTLGGNACGQFIPESKLIKGSRFGMEALLWIMSVAGSKNIMKIEGSFVRVAFDKNERAQFIGHIVKDIWLNFDWLANIQN